jgi:hypothetical protein
MSFEAAVEAAVALLRAVEARGTESEFDQARLARLLQQITDALMAEPLSDNVLIEYPEDPRRATN